MIARNDRELFSSNHGNSQLTEARCIDDLSRGSVLGNEILTNNYCSKCTVVASLKLCFVSVLCCFNELVDHGCRRGDTAQALAQWWHTVASSEALDVLYRAMCPVLYRCIMAIEIARFAFIFVVTDFIVIVAHNSS